MTDPEQGGELAIDPEAVGRVWHLLMAERDALVRQLKNREHQILAMLEWQAKLEAALRRMVRACDLQDDGDEAYDAAKALLAELAAEEDAK